MNTQDRLETATIVVCKLGKHRACEATRQQASAIPNPLGAEFIGVDGCGPYRARIRVCDALSGRDKRVTLGRFDDAEDAAFAYRAAHVALYGSFSWAIESISSPELFLIEYTRNAVLNG